MTTSTPRRRRIAAATLLASTGAVLAIGLGAVAPANAGVSGASGSSDAGQIQGENQANENGNLTSVTKTIGEMRGIGAGSRSGL